MNFKSSSASSKKITFGKISLASSSATSSDPQPVSSRTTDVSKASVGEADSSVGEGFGSFSWSQSQAADKADKETADSKSQDEEEERMKRMMGFSDFGTSKKPEQQKSARKFSVKELMEQIKSSKQATSGTDTKIEIDMEGVRLHDNVHPSGEPLQVII